MWLDIYAVRCCAAVPHFSSCLWPNLLGFSTKMKKFIWVTKMRSYISVLAAPCPCLTFLSVYKRAFIDLLIRRNSYQQKSGDISACQSWTVLVITAVSHISAADFTVPLSNHISQGKCFWYNFWKITIWALASFCPLNFSKRPRHHSFMWQCTYYDLQYYVSNLWVETRVWSVSSVTPHICWFAYERWTRVDKDTAEI